MQGNITLGGTSVDPACRQRAYKVTTELAIAMRLDVYIYQGRDFLVLQVLAEGIRAAGELHNRWRLHPPILLVGEGVISIRPTLPSAKRVNSGPSHPETCTKRD